MKKIHIVVYAHDSEHSDKHTISRTEENIEKALLYGQCQHELKGNCSISLYFAKTEDFSNTRHSLGSLVEYVTRRLKHPIARRSFEPEITYTRVFSEKLTEQTRAFVKRVREDNIPSLHVSCSKRSRWFIRLLWKWRGKDIVIRFV